MAQTSHNVQDKATGHQLTAAEFNAVKNAVNLNAQDAEPRLQGTEAHAGSPHAPPNATAAGTAGDAHAGATGNPHGTTAAEVGAAPDSHGHANTDISGLGTMSTQNANTVAITGGSINISGGTLTLADGQIDASKVATTEMFVLAAPSPTSTGIPGQRYYAANYVYECIAANTWVRYAAESTWS
jgi:hypothetical protein